MRNHPFPDYVNSFDSFQAYSIVIKVATKVSIKIKFAAQGSGMTKTTKNRYGHVPSNQGILEISLVY
jgi:hypothetical protein